MYKILDLFSGAGGFSLGLDSLKGFKTVLATDFNDSALQTLKHNFPHCKTINGDITDSNIKQKIIDHAKALNVNMIIGGPPCQGFSNKGKKLGLKDPRNFLFLEYLKIVEAISPELFIIENVPSLLTAADGYFIKEIKEKINDLGYIVNYDVLNSFDFGVPQVRKRAIIIAHKTKSISLPLPQNTRVTVKDAISDLSYLNSGEGENETSYKYKPQSSYQKQLRNPSGRLFNHVATKHNSVALEKLELIPPEGGKESLPIELRGKQKFKTTWGRLKWDLPSPTIDTRFDTPSNGTNSHPYLNRAITPREAARIQSFPDWFEFKGKKTAICTQIGNAVPPLLATKIGEAILEQLNRNDVYESKNVKLYNRDSYQIIDELKKSGITFSHIITDPPYNISQENNFSTMSSSKRKGLDFGEWDKNFDLFSWIKPYTQLLDKDGSIIIFCSFRNISHIVESLESSGLVVKDILKWIKSNPMPRNINRRYVQDTEFAIWAVKEKSKWIFNKPEEESYLRAQFEYPVVAGKERTEHPTQKSLALMEKIITIHTNENDLIIDPFMGSGTTGVAALNLNRKFIGVEISEDYFNIAKKRIEAIKKY